MRNQRIPMTSLWLEPNLSPTVKTLKTTASRHSDTVSGLPEAQGWQFPDVFPEKPGRFFPIRNPLYFQATNAFFSPPDAL